MNRTVSRRPALWLTASLCLAASPVFGQILYVTNTTDRTIAAYVIAEDSGSLSEILPRAAAPGIPSSVAVHPSGKFAYVTTGGPPTLTMYSIDPGTGALTQGGNSPLPSGSNPQEVVIDSAGKFAFVALPGANSAAAFSIDPVTGAASAVPGSPFTTPANPNSVVVHPNGKFVYVAAAAAGQIAAFSIAPSGALTPVDGSPFAARNTMQWMTMDPAGKSLYAVERQDNGVLAYSVNAATGALTQIQGSPFPTAPGVSGVTVDPAGKFLYTSNFGVVNGYRIGATGALTQISGWGAANNSSAAIMDPWGKYLFVLGPLSNDISEYSIDAASGVLTFAGQPVPTGASPSRGTTVLLNPPVVPPISINIPFNYHSHAPAGMPNASIAQGSRMAISGKNIGPVSAPQGDFPLTTELGGVSIQIQSGDVTTAALMVFVSNDFVTCVVPSTTPLGDATVTVTFNGRTSPPAPVTIVTTSVGLRTLNDFGVGPAKAWNLPPDVVLAPNPGILQTPNNLTQSAKPGGLVAVQATGLGPVDFDETQNLSQELNVPANVVVGNKLVPTAYQLRIADGSDYIVFKIPDDVSQGCYVPIAVQAGGVTSNVAHISVSAAGGSCSDPAGLSASDLDAAQKSGQIRMGTVVLSHIDFGPFGPMDNATGMFIRYNFNDLLAVFSPGNDGPGIRSSFVTPPVGTCSVWPGSPTRPGNPFYTPGDPTPLQFLNAGPLLNLSGPAGKLQLPAPDYSFNFKDAIGQGDFTVDNGTGTQAVGAFKGVITVPPVLTWTNRDAMSSVDRTQDLTLTWTGGLADKEIALIAGLSASQQAVGGFLCTEKVSAGTFTIPAWVLSSLPQSDTFTPDGPPIPGGIVALGTASVTSAGRFTAPGLDFGVVTYEQAALNLVLYQ